MIDTSKLKGPLGLSILSIAVLLVLGIIGISSIVSPLFGRSNSMVNSTTSNTLLKQHESYIAMDIARFNGRSAFFKPIRIAVPLPPPPPPIENDTPEVPDTIIEQGPPPAPANYMGPALIAIIGDEAWFKGSSSGPDSVLKIKIGEESQGIKVISTSAPSLVTVEHRRGIYPIHLFESSEDFFREEALPPTSNDFLQEVEG
ncbi:MAG TPA: hypothetical protein EYO01_03440 [Phycisphaerales bacterium]|jgi:hypothetical protein|nr:hypothetical protein [Phycisphaerales bacterium]HIB50207.1 hypothetical protein [Phycisphaerales bacterium]